MEEKKYMPLYDTAKISFMAKNSEGSMHAAILFSNVISERDPDNISNDRSDDRFIIHAPRGYIKYKLTTCSQRPDFIVNVLSCTPEENNIYIARLRQHANVLYMHYTSKSIYRDVLIMPQDGYKFYLPGSQVASDIIIRVHRNNAPALWLFKEKVAVANITNKEKTISSQEEIDKHCEEYSRLLRYHPKLHIPERSATDVLNLAREIQFVGGITAKISQEIDSKEPISREVAHIISIFRQHPKKTHLLEISYYTFRYYLEEILRYHATKMIATRCAHPYDMINSDYYHTKEAPILKDPDFIALYGDFINKTSNYFNALMSHPYRSMQYFGEFFDVLDKVVAYRKYKSISEHSYSALDIIHLNEIYNRPIGQYVIAYHLLYSFERLNAKIGISTALSVMQSRSSAANIPISPVTFPDIKSNTSLGGHIVENAENIPFSKLSPPVPRYNAMQQDINSRSVSVIKPIAVKARVNTSSIINSNDMVLDNEAEIGAAQILADMVEKKKRKR